jgi:hypothetical protein
MPALGLDRRRVTFDRLELDESVPKLAVNQVLPEAVSVPAVALERLLEMVSAFIAKADTSKKASRGSVLLCKDRPPSFKAFSKNFIDIYSFDNWGVSGISGIALITGSPFVKASEGAAVQVL